MVLSLKLTDCVFDETLVDVGVEARDPLNESSTMPERGLVSTATKFNVVCVS